MTLERTKTNPSAAGSDSVELWTGTRALPLRAFSQKNQTTKTKPCAETIRARPDPIRPDPTRPDPDTHFVKVQTGSVSKNPRNYFPFTICTLFTQFTEFTTFFFSVASDFKLTFDGEKKKEIKRRRRARLLPSRHSAVIHINKTIIRRASTVN